MIIDNIYKSDILKYPLNDDEIGILNNCWELLNEMNKKYIFIFEQRKNLIKFVKNKYTIDEFYVIENVINKLFWNLRWLIYPLFSDNKINEIKYDEIITENKLDALPKYLTLCECMKYDDINDLKYKIKNSTVYESNFYKSYINKIIIVDKKNKTLYLKPMEGSSSIFNKNYFNLLTMSILFDRKMYEKIMKNPYKILNTKIQLSNFYYQYDYGFPNLNFCTYYFGDESQRLDRIKKMYYYKGSKYWKKLII